MMLVGPVTAIQGRGSAYLRMARDAACRGVNAVAEVTARARSTARIRAMVEGPNVKFVFAFRVGKNSRQHNESDKRLRFIVVL